MNTLYFIIGAGLGYLSVSAGHVNSSILRKGSLKSVSITRKTLDYRLFKTKSWNQDWWRKEVWFQSFKRFHKWSHHRRVFSYFQPTRRQKYTARKSSYYGRSGDNIRSRGVLSGAWNLRANDYLEWATYTSSSDANCRVNFCNRSSFDSVSDFQKEKENIKQRSDPET